MVLSFFWVFSGWLCTIENVRFHLKECSIVIIQAIKWVAIYDEAPTWTGSLACKGLRSSELPPLVFGRDRLEIRTNPVSFENTAVFKREPQWVGQKWLGTLAEQLSGSVCRGSWESGLVVSGIISWLLAILFEVSARRNPAWRSTNVTCGGSFFASTRPHCRFSQRIVAAVLLYLF